MIYDMTSSQLQIGQKSISSTLVSLDGGMVALTALGNGCLADQNVDPLWQISELLKNMIVEFLTVRK